MVKNENEGGGQTIRGYRFSKKRFQEKEKKQEGWLRRYRRLLCAGEETKEKMEGLLWLARGPTRYHTHITHMQTEEVIW
jgi:hypothetical protein